MTNITELAQRMKTAAEKATQGEWWADEVKNEGCYGSGDDCVEGFTSYAIYGADGQTLFDSLNSDAACISEEYDGEGHVAWDETAQRNAEFIALANPANILALVEALEYYKSREERVTSLVRDNSKSWDELYRQVEAKGKRNVELVEALESEKRICATWRKTAEANSEKLEKAQQQMTESENRVRKQNRHICELFDDNTALRQRIAGLEARTVTVKQGEVLVTVAGFTGCGKSAIAGEIEIAMKAIGLPVTWANGDTEKRMTGADWLTAIEMYKPTVRIVEVNIPRAAGIKVEAE
ncbi:ead/Ea22-like family protein [Klebsiella pneumoniae]|uniref:ead/Ea22-like family protein n=1 Tax=Klebsiella pneumoniae TaxID=573 RepID=UPI003CF3D67E